MDSSCVEKIGGGVDFDYNYVVILNSGQGPGGIFYVDYLGRSKLSSVAFPQHEFHTHTL